MRASMVLVCCFAGWIFGQSEQLRPAFEVATIKPSPPANGRPILGTKGGGPGTRDPSRVSFQNFFLSNLVMEAYEAKHYQFSAPSWLETERFDILARIPDGTTKDQVPLMLQKLLADRFHLVIHREKREGTVYELAVGKSGPKLKVSTENQDDPQSFPPRAGPGKLDGDGFPVPPPGRGLRIIGMNRRMSMRYTEASMPQLVTFLSNQLDRPVLDATGLTGKYDLSLHWVSDGLLKGLGDYAPPIPPPGDDFGPTLFEAIQGQLGLRLDQKKDMIEIIVVDSIDKMPTEN